MVWPQANRQGLVRIGGVRIGARHEMLARDLVHGAQHRGVGYPVPPQIEQEFHAADPVVGRRR